MTSAVAALRRWIGLLSLSDELAAKAVRFSLVGVLSGMVFLMATALLAGTIGIEPKIASAVGYVASMPANFIGNRQFSFKSRGTLLGDLSRFLLLHICNIVLTMGAMGAIVNVLNMHFGFGAAAAMVLVPLANFAVMNLWVFGRKVNGLSARATKNVS